VFGAVVTAFAVGSARHLQIRTELAGLLPPSSTSAADYRTFLSVFGGLEKVFVVVRPPLSATDDDAGRVTEAAIELARLLADSPEVAGVKAGVSLDDEDFFLEQVVPRSALLAGEDWRRSLEDRMRPEALTISVRSMCSTVTTWTLVDFSLFF